MSHWPSFLKQYLKILEVHTINLDKPRSGGTEEVEISHPDISDPYYIVSPINYWATTEDYIEERDIYILGIYRVGVKKVSSTSVKVGWFPYAFAEAGEPADSGLNNTIKLLVCKV